ncbi:MAG: radical SAM protein [Candidatus Hodarchaeota archaeon]
MQDGNTIHKVNALELRAPSEDHLDTPFPGRDYRIYIAVTNRCNRHCPFCAVYSSMEGTSFINLDQISRQVPGKGTFQVQFEGGEPFLHPDIFSFIDTFASHPRCSRVIISTNGSLFPFAMEGNEIDEEKSFEQLKAYFSRLPPVFTLKVSLNQYLHENDPLLFEKARVLTKFLDETGVELIFNLRKRNHPRHDQDIHLEEEVDKHGIRHKTNSFFLQCYGRNSDDENAEKPYLVGTNFILVNPDGTEWGTDLVARSEAMGRLK